MGVGGSPRGRSLRPGREEAGSSENEGSAAHGAEVPRGHQGPSIWDRGGGPGRAGARGGRDSLVACRTSAGHSAAPRWAIGARARPSRTQFPYLLSTPVQEHRILCIGRDLRAWPVRGTWKLNFTFPKCPAGLEGTL